MGTARCPLKDKTTDSLIRSKTDTVRKFPRKTPTDNPFLNKDIRIKCYKGRGI